MLIKIALLILFASVLYGTHINTVTPKSNEEIVIEENEDGIILLIILNGVKPFQMGVTKISIINGNVYKLYAYQHTIFLSIHNTIALHILFRGSEYVPPKEELEKPLDINPKELHKQQGGI